MKTFTETMGEKLQPIFTEFKTCPTLLGYVTNGTPIGVAAYLQSTLAEGGDGEEVSLAIKNKAGTLMEFKLTAVKKGDSIAFLPSFEIGEVGQDLINADDIDFDITAIDSMALEMLKNKKFVDCLNNAYFGNVYVDGKWIESEANGSDTFGICFDAEDDIATCAAGYFCAIIEILCKYKDVNSEIEYEVPNLGKFKLVPSKNNYNVTLTFDKGYKSNCKSDKLAEVLAVK